jgi:hypothetical protein
MFKIEKLNDIDQILDDLLLSNGLFRYNFVDMVSVELMDEVDFLFNHEIGISTKIILKIY